MKTPKKTPKIPQTPYLHVIIETHESRSEMDTRKHSGSIIKLCHEAFEKARCEYMRALVEIAKRNNKRW